MKEVANINIDSSNYENNLIQTISQQISLLDVNIESCDLIVNFISKFKINNEEKYWLLHFKGQFAYLNIIAINHLFEAVSITKSLVNPTNSRKEITFLNPYLEFKKETSDSIQILAEKFRTIKLEKFRNNVSSHKNKNAIKRPINYIFEFRYNEILDKLIDIRNDISGIIRLEPKFDVTYVLVGEPANGLQFYLDFIDQLQV